MVSSGKSDKGILRSKNEDSLYLSDAKIGGLPNLYVIADGMGGCNAGEVASEYSIRYFREYIEQRQPSERELLDYMVDAASYANDMLYEHSMKDASLTGMGTTFTACAVHEGRLYIAHVGDSRIYSIVDSSINQITADHSYVNEMVKAGHITKEQADFHPKKNLLTRAFGVGRNVPIDGIVHVLSENEKILLCSDGLTNMLSDNDICYIIKNNADEKEAVEQLISAANGNGGVDNISVILIDTTR